jgi:hypothetical protein
MTPVVWNTIVVAIRDMAEKVNEQEVTKRMERDSSNYYQEREVQYHSEKYSKDWIAGRLLGMADMLDAMAFQKPKDDA